MFYPQVADTNPLSITSGAQNAVLLSEGYPGVAASDFMDIVAGYPTAILRFNSISFWQ